MVTKQICEFREVILKNIFNEYNHYHDKFGRFTSAGGVVSGGANSVNRQKV